jgi:hypothetical protein
MDNSDSDIQKGVKIALQVVVPYLFLRLFWVFLFPIYTPELSPAARKIERQLQEQPPEIVFLGNSTIHRAIDFSIFAKHLQVPESSLQKIWLGDAPLPTLYTVVKERIYENGYSPKLIIVGTSPLWLVSNQVPEGGPLLDFQAQLSLVEDDIVIQERLAKNVPKRTLLGVQKEALREGFLEGIRNSVSERFFALTPKQTVKKLDEVFAFERRRKISIKRMIPIVEGSTEKSNISNEYDYSLQTSFAISMAELARKMGSKIVFVEVPMKKGTIKQKKHLISKDLHRELSKELVSLGAGHIHYTYKSLPHHSFADSLHLNERGRREMSKMLAEDLLKIGVFNDNWETKSIPLELSRFFQIANLQDQESKDNLILGSGKKIQLIFTEDWHKGWGELKISAVISASDISQVSATLTLECGSMVPFEPVKALKSEDNVEILTAKVKGENCKKGNTLTLKNISKNNQIAVHSIHFNHISVLPEGEDNISLLSNSNVITYSDRELKKDAKETKIGGDYLTFTIDDFSFLSGKNMVEKHGDYLCSPLFVLENQKVFSEKIETCRNLRSSKSSGFCLGQETILIQKDSGGPEDWLANAFHLTLNPNRSCLNMWWFYAGDRLSVIGKNIFTDFEGGSVTSLKISAQAFSTGTWQIRLSISDEVLLHHTFSEKDLEEKYLQLPLLRPLEGKGEIEVLITGDGYMTISEISLGN